MYALASALLRNDEDDGAGLFDLPERPQLKGPHSWRDHGFSFLPIRKAHLEFLAHVYDRQELPFDMVLGRAMVDINCLPIGVCLVHFERTGENTLHAHFGKWLKVFPKDILRGIRPVCDRLRKHEIYILHAIADVKVDGSEKLIRWLGGEPTGKHNADGIGPIFTIDLRRCPL